MKCSGNEFALKVSHACISDNKMRNEGMDICPRCLRASKGGLYE